MTPELEALRKLKGIPPSEVKLRRSMGSGGVSDLWLATHPRVQSPFIVKYGRFTSMHNPYIYGQFEREYEASQALLAQGIEGCTAYVFDFDIDDFEHPYVFEEYFPSLSLASLIPSTGEWYVARQILSRIARILSKIHAAGIVHRDIKPGNILISQLGEVRVIDFALSTIDGRWHRYHEEGMALGTPLYMSPEQAYGRKIMLTSACDWYSLGVILFEWMSGDLPFVGKTSMETMSMHCHSPAPLPVNHRIHGAPPELPEICRDLLCKEPNARFSAVRTLNAVLHQ